MKKFFSCVGLCFSVTSVWGMDERPIDVVDDCVAALIKSGKISPSQKKDLDEVVLFASERRVKLTFAKQDSLDLALRAEMIRCKSPWDMADYSEVKRLLNSGAWPCPLCAHNALYDPSRKLLALFLAYYLDPNISVEWGTRYHPIITQVTDLTAMRMLVGVGADINASAVKYGYTVLYAVCTCPRFKRVSETSYVPNVVWALQHGACANPDPKKDHQFVPLNGTIGTSGDDQLEKTIALLQQGADCQKAFCSRESAIDFARSLASEHQFSLQHQAQYALLRAVTEAGLDSRHVYMLPEYASMGISDDSAELIRAATQAVNAATAKCVREDDEFERSKVGESVS